MNPETIKTFLNRVDVIHFLRCDDLRSVYSIFEDEFGDSNIKYLSIFLALSGIDPENYLNLKPNILYNDLLYASKVY